MSVTLHLSCDGCHATADFPLPRRELVKTFGGTGSGFHHREPFDVESACGDWMASDPVTACTYCPKCQREIWPDDGEPR